VDSKMVTSKPGHSKRVVFPDPVQGVRYISTSKLPPKHQTVFAMTIHSAQGSEFGHAMVVLPKKISPLITREMIYTGVTRGKERMTMVGNQKILEKGLVAKIQRASGLKQLLWEL